MSSDVLRIKVLTQEFRDVLYQLKDFELSTLLRDHPEEATRLLTMLKDIYPGKRRSVEHAT